MISLDEARTRLLDNAPAPRTGCLPLAEAAGYVLAEAVRADRPIPPFDRAAMDGYAVRSGDLGPDGGELLCVGEIRPGARYAEPVPPGACVAIMTGAPVPAGADAVVEVEATDSGRFDPQVVQVGRRIRFLTAPKSGQNIAACGEDAREGNVLLEAGEELGPVACGLLALCGHVEVRVYERPRIALLSTGNEIVAPEAMPGPYQIRDANRTLAAAILGRYGFTRLTQLGIVPDEADQLRRAIATGLESDLLILSGGVSMGTSDLVPQVLAELGVTCLFAGVAVKPGMPLWAGVARSGAIVLAMPGNPLAVVVQSSEAAVPLLRKMSGHARPVLPLRRVALADGVSIRGDRLVVRAAVIEDLERETPVATCLPSHGSADLVWAARANGLMFLPIEKTRYEKGELVDARIWP